MTSLVLQWQKVELRFRTPIPTAKSVWKERNTFLIKLSDGKYFGIGEAAPLPEWGTETEGELTDTLRQISTQNTLHCDKETDLSSIGQIISHELFLKRPVLRFALECAMLDRLGKINQKPLFELLSSRYSTQPTMMIRVSTLLASEGDASFFQTATTYWSQGFDTFKVKASSDFDNDVKRLARIIETFPGIRIRYDVNGSWSVEESKQKMRALVKIPLDYIEQPVSPSNMPKLLESHDLPHLPIALDESVANETQVRYWFEQGVPVVFILKPMVIGGLCRTLDFAHTIQNAGRRVVLSSAMDSGVAATAYNHIASVLGDSVTAHGIATHRLLELDTIIRKPDDIHPIIKLNPGDFGLGIQLSSGIESKFTR